MTSFFPWTCMCCFSQKKVNSPLSLFCFVSFIFTGVLHSRTFCQTLIPSFTVPFQDIFHFDEIRCYFWNKITGNGSKNRLSLEQLDKYHWNAGHMHGSPGLTNTSAATNYHFIFCTSFWLKCIFQITPHCVSISLYRLSVPIYPSLNTEQNNLWVTLEAENSHQKNKCMSVWLFIQACQRFMAISCTCVDCY